MKKIIIAFFAALIVTLSIEGYNFYRGFEDFSLLREISLFLMSFIVIYSTLFFYKRNN
jgi:hypothetical protein